MSVLIKFKSQFSKWNVDPEGVLKYGFRVFLSLSGSSRNEVSMLSFVFEYGFDVLLDSLIVSCLSVVIRNEMSLFFVILNIDSILFFNLSGHIM